MQLGICTSAGRSGEVKRAGWDFVEESVQALLQGTVPDDQWDGLRRARASALPVRAANMLVPAALKITGPEASPPRLEEYLARVTDRAREVGIHTLVFGSGGARNVPDGFDRGRAREQILAFARTAAELAGRRGITVVVEPLNRGECNIVNSVAEAMEYVRAVGHPNLQCLLDSYHFWLEDEPLEHLRDAVRSIRHVHVADKLGRVAPGESGAADYRPLFAELKRGGYDGLVSVEALGFDDFENVAPRVLGFLKRQWAEA